MPGKWQGQDPHPLMADTTSCGLSSPPAPSLDEGLSVSEGIHCCSGDHRTGTSPGRRGCEVRGTCVPILHPSLACSVVLSVFTDFLASQFPPL